MVTPSKVLAEKADFIFKEWKEKVRKDRKIQSSKDLPDTALGNSMPELLESMVTALDSSEDDDFEVIAKASLEHGRLRAAQGYNAAEIAREYSLLRQVIFSALEPDFIKDENQVQARSFFLINAVIDEAIAMCFNQFVEEQTQELNHVQNQLKLTNQELTRLLRGNQESFSYLAHELKTPLNSIMGYSELLLRQQQKNTSEAPKSSTHIERLLRSSRQLLRLVNDCLELSRYDAGKIELRLASIAVVPIIKSAVEMIEPLAQEKNLHIEVDFQEAPGEVMTDAFRLQQIVTNLLSNAVRYTDTGSIKVHCATLPDQNWLITVRDTGIGIAPESQKYIFEPFSQPFAGSKQARAGSTGLGLAIVSRLTKLLKGEISLTSTLGEGSIFTVTFPVNLTINDQKA
jgi:signal transduction histidine kinase